MKNFLDKRQKITSSQLFNTIVIVGVGLIGGSIGLAVKKRKLANKLIGMGRREISLKKALKIGAIDEISLDKSKVKDADLVIIATPVGKIIPLVKELIPYLKKGTIITDVGSTKREIMDDICEFIQQSISFIGGHPLAGSEKNGVEFADADLFEKSICFLTPCKNKATKKSLMKINFFWEALGAYPVIVSAQEHDFLVAGISHLPHIVAVALVNSLSNVKWQGKDITNFAGQGWKDTTRIAKGLPEIWLDILSSNREQLLMFIKRFDRQWNKIKESLRKKELERLKILLENAVKKTFSND